MTLPNDIQLGDYGAKAITAQPYHACALQYHNKGSRSKRRLPDALEAYQFR